MRSQHRARRLLAARLQGHMARHRRRRLPRGCRGGTRRCQQGALYAAHRAAALHRAAIGRGGPPRAQQLNGATVCVQPGTTTELNLADYFRANNMKFKPVVIEKLEEVLGAYFAGRCDAFTTDHSGLVALRASRAPKPDEHVILPEIISKEPLGPAVRHGDDRWFDVVKWSLFAMLEAEELGLNSGNIDAQAKSPNPAIQRFVGASGDLGTLLGVDNKWAYQIVKQVGNYGESFDANLKPLGFERGLNRLWNQGGLMYAPPLR